MACLGGTAEAPKTWVRLKSNGAVQSMESGPFACRQRSINPVGTSRRLCSSCPAYRGVRWDGTTASGVAPDGTPYALSEQEYALYEKAVDATFDDDFTLYSAFLDRMQSGIGERTLRVIGDPDAQERWAAYMREYRASMDETQREKTRAATRERVRRHRQLKREVCNVSSPLARGQE